MDKKLKPQSGFTLLELLVVIAIIGTLAGVVSLSVSNARAKSRDAKRVGDIKQLISALEQYNIQNGSYPTGTGSVASNGSGVILSDPTAIDGGPEPFVPNYLPFMPTAPVPHDGDCQIDAGPGNNNYWYWVEDDGSTYELSFCLGTDNESWKAGSHIAGPSGVQ